MALAPPRPQALQGFCSKSGADPASVVVEADAKGVEYCWVAVSDAGRSAAEVRGRGRLLGCCKWDEMGVLLG